MALRPKPDCAPPRDNAGHNYPSNLASRSIEYTDNNANLRYYYPDFVVKTETGEMWLVETKGQESLEVAFKDRAAGLWCENATRLTGEQWSYVKVPQKEYQKLQPVEFYDLLTFVSEVGDIRATRYP